MAEKMTIIEYWNRKDVQKSGRKNGCHQVKIAGHDGLGECIVEGAGVDCNLSRIHE